MPSVAIKIGAELAEEARAAAKDADRSLTGQVEHWARVGRVMESHFSATDVSLLKKFGGDPSNLENDSEIARVEALLASVRAMPASTLRAAMGISDKDIYEPDPRNKGGITKVSPDGSRTSGVMYGRKFVPTEPNEQKVAEDA